MLDININPYKGILFVRLKGVLNKTSIQKLQDEVSKLIREVGIKNIVFNLKELSEIDYDGILELSKNCDYCISHYGKALLVSDRKIPYVNSNLKNRVVGDERSAAELINM